MRLLSWSVVCRDKRVLPKQPSLVRFNHEVKHLLERLLLGPEDQFVLESLELVHMVGRKSLLVDFGYVLQGVHRRRLDRSHQSEWT